MFRALLILSMSIFCTLAVCSNPTRAQAPTTSVQDISLEAQSLATSLVAIGRAFSVSVIASDALTQGKTAPSIKGGMTAMEALRTALSNTELVAEAQGPKTFVVVAPRETDRPSAATVDSAVMEEILVFGTKNNLSQQKTSTSVEIFTPERIENEVLFTVDDVLLRTPNVSVNLIGGTNYSIRGVNTRGVGGAGTGSTSQLYVDGSPLILAQNGVQSLWDLAQIEVLRGPQSTVQGRNALSGAIVAYTADPTYEWGGRARIQAGTEELLNASFAFGGPIVEDQVAFRLSYDHQEVNTGHKEVSTGLDQQFFDVNTARGKLLFEPAVAPGLRIELIAERSETETGDFNFAIAPVTADDPAFESYDPFAGETHARINFSDLENDRFIADLRYALNDEWTLIGLATYEDTTQSRRFNIGLPATLNVPESTGSSNQTVTSFELRAAFDHDRFSGWVGAYYFEQEDSNDGQFAVPLGALGLPVDPPQSLGFVANVSGSRVRNDAVFADVTFALNERWSLNLGARYDRERFGDNAVSGSVFTDPETCTIGGVIPCAAAIAGFAPNEAATPTDFEAFLPRVGLSHAINDESDLFFTVARGYRAGGIRQFFDPVTLTNVTNSFDPEFLTNYELAYRSLWLDGRLALNANLFYAEWEDQQVVVPSAQIDSRLSLVENAGESEYYGLELTVNHQLTNALDYFVSLGLLRTEFLDFPFAEAPGPFENIAGNSFTTAPETTLAAGVNYLHRSGWYTNWSINYRSEQFSEVANLPINEVEAATLVNGRVGYRFGPWNLYAFGNNVFDERFATERSFANVDTTTGVVVPTNLASYRINFGRIAGAALEYGF